MGAWMTEQVASGKTASEAYRRARSDAQAEYGHQEGYSGAINSKDGGFVMVDLPGRCDYRKFVDLLHDFEETSYIDTFRLSHLLELERGGKKGLKGQIAKERKAVERQKKERAKVVAKIEAAGFDLYTFERLAETFNDKWGSPLCVEFSAHLAKKFYPNTYANKRRGEKIFVFFGYAPC